MTEKRLFLMDSLLPARHSEAGYPSELSIRCVLPAGRKRIADLQRFTDSYNAKTGFTKK